MEPHGHDSNEHEPNAGSEAIEELVFAFLERCEGTGEPPSELLEELCREHPDVETQLRATVEMLAGTGLGLTDGEAAEPQQSIGDYVLLERLGAGGMGVVHRARPASGGPEVALKLLHPQLQAEPEVRERFAREVRAIERLDHPAIVRVHDHGEVLRDGVSTPYLAMALRQGVSLDEAIRTLKSSGVQTTDGAEVGGQLFTAIEPDVDPLSRSSRLRGPWWQVACRLAADLGSALAHAHENGVVHRDVKPSNVLATPDGRLLLLDFGLAVTADSWRLTRSGARLGSLPYMAPEQVAGRTTDARVDVYGLGLVLYELLTFQPAFEITSPDALVVAIERGVSLRPSRTVNWIPDDVAAAVDAVVERATDRSAEGRYATAREFADDLRALVAGEPLVAQPISTIGRAVRAVRRRPWHATLAALVLAFAAIGAVVAANYERRIADDERDTVETEIATIADQLELMDKGRSVFSGSSLEDDPRYAPQALPVLVPQRETLLGVRDRLQELARQGEDVEALERQVDVTLSGVLREVAASLTSLGRYEEAVEAQERYREHVEALLESGFARNEDERLELRFKRAKSIGSLARTIRLSSYTAPMLDPATLAVDLQTELFDAGYRRKDVAFALVTSLMLQSEGHWRVEDRQAAAAALDRAERVSIETFGEDPIDLNLRTQRGEIDLRRGYFELGATNRDEKIALMLRGIAWFDGSARDVTTDESVATLRLGAGMLLADELRAARRFDEAATWIQDAITRTEGILEDRGGAARPDDPFATMLSEMKAVEARIRVDSGEREARKEVIAMRRVEFEGARIRHLERPTDTDLLLARIRTAARYANEAAWELESDLVEVQNALTAVESALEASAGIDEGPWAVFGRVRSCRYARSLALVRLSRFDESREAIEEIVEIAYTREPTDVRSLWFAVDLWAELYRSVPEGEATAELGPRVLGAVEAVVEAGFRDADALRRAEVLAPFQEEPRFRAVLERIEAESSAGD